MNKEKDLQGKKILAFAPRGREGRYGGEILLELERRGAFVSMYPERPSLSTFSKILVRLLKNFFPGFFLAFLKRIITENKNIDFDFILVIRGEAFTNKAVDLLKSFYPKAFTILYLWDILAVNDKRSIFKSFDKVLSFDSGDVARNNGLYFRPLFFLKRHQEIKHCEYKEIDICFAGTIHSVRYQILKKVEKIYGDKYNLYFYYFLPSRILFIKNIIVRNYPLGTPINHFRFKMLPESDLYSMMANSKSIIDICHPKQESLSLRVMEAMGAKMKLITDFKGIEKYDFFCENNILIIDPKEPVIPISFLNQPYKNLLNEIESKYTLAAWVDDIFFNLKSFDHFSK